ncbi:hypothetical protein RJ640_027585 [Escallonia rubra]|uniref:protein-serine/threonine phosphatase n=1 Tax=Escallonia rubra TaxID=112253 RepID=A0AA88U299_9ASTE|nr:hypothetical protein RJ640_027585 [Escallonia rubra]
MLHQSRYPPLVRIFSKAGGIKPTSRAYSTLQIRDTSVLVRLRPAWEDLRSYLIAKGRKRFEVYVCTMAERDYALEMWKSLFNVFQDGNCHPKMAMVIDDRMKVWEDKDQPRVHVVPAFTPYYAPQAETANAVPVLCVARNVACNVRGGFFKEFDDNILRRISDLFYEDEVASLPAAPDASNYMMSEDASFVLNGSASAPMAEGMHGPEVAQRLNHLDDKNVTDSSTQSLNFGSERRPEISQLPFPPVPTVFGPASSRAVLPLEKPSLLGAPFKRDTSFSESDEDIKRRFLMNPSQDARYRGLEPPILSRLPAQVLVPHMHPQGGWLVEEDISRGHLNNQAGTIQGSDALRPDKWREQGRQNILSHSTLGPVPVGIQSHASAMKSEVVSL